MAASKVKRSTNKPKVVHRYKAAHKRANKPAEDCKASITRGTKTKSVTTDCTSCLGKKVQFDYDREVVPNALK